MQKTNKGKIIQPYLYNNWRTGLITQSVFLYLYVQNCKYMNILEQANEIINKRSEEKDRQYGPIGEGMEVAAQIFNAISPENERITPEGMFRALIALKFSREHFNHKEDNLLDAVAYIGALNNYINEKKNNK